MLTLNAILVSLVLFVSPQERLSNDPLAMLEHYHLNKQAWGPGHPRMVELRERIADIAALEKEELGLDMEKVQNRMDELFLERKSLLRNQGIRHPRAIENAIRISIMARLLAGDCDQIVAEIARDE